jgi:hypothetical protein
VLLTLAPAALGQQPTGCYDPSGNPIPCTPVPPPVVTEEIHDRDGDGIPDDGDRCPDQGGPVQNNGCPGAADSDGDGTPDESDKCPTEGGPAQNAGCPDGSPSGNDKDGDSIADSQDRCPNQAGLPDRGGCLPELPTTGPCILATGGNLDVNIRGLPAVQSPVVGLLDPNTTLPILNQLETEDDTWYLSEQGWTARRAVRLGGDCSDIENPNPNLPCAVLDKLTANEAEQAKNDGFDSDNCLNSPLGSGPGDEVNACMVNPDFNDDGTADMVTGSETGGSFITITDGASSEALQSFSAFDPGFTGGVFVAAGDVNGNGTPDVIVGAGAGAGPHVKVFDGATSAELASFFAYAPAFTGGVRVAAGDINGDGFADIVTGTGPGAGPHVKVFDGATSAELASFFAYAPTFTGGVFVSVGDVNGDGTPDIITSTDAGGAPHVKVFDGQTTTPIMSFFAYDGGFTGGVRVASGDLNGDCAAEIITGAGPGAGPHIKVFDGATLAPLASFFAFSPGFTGGVFVAVGDVNGDGSPDIIARANLEGAMHIRGFDGASLALLSDMIV